MDIQDIRKKRANLAEDPLFHYIWVKDQMYVNIECLVNSAFTAHSEKQSLFSSQQNFSQKKSLKPLKKSGG